MVLGIYVIKDIKSCFMTPNFDMNDASAMRNFKMAISNAETVLHYSPEDFVFYKIGEYDNQTGLVHSIDPVVILRGEDIKEFV